MNAVDQVLSGDEPTPASAPTTVTAIATVVPNPFAATKVEDDRDGWHKDNNNASGTGNGAGTGTNNNKG